MLTAAAKLQARLQLNPPSRSFRNRVSQGAQGARRRISHPVGSLSCFFSSLQKVTRHSFAALREDQTGMRCGSR